MKTVHSPGLVALLLALSSFGGRASSYWRPPPRLELLMSTISASMFIAHYPRYAVFSVRFDAVLVSGLWPRHLPDVWRPPE